VHTIVIALVGTVATVWTARAARRYAVVDRVRPLAVSSGRLPGWVHARLARALDAAAVDVSPEHAVQVVLLGAGCVGVIGLGTSPIVAVGASTAVVVGAASWLHTARFRRGRQVAAAIPAALDVIAADLRAGGTVATGVATLANGRGPLASDFGRVEARVRLGAALPDALASWAGERRAAGAASVAGALALAGSVGGRCAEALEGLASSLRERAAVIAEARALSAQARYSALVIGLGPIVYLALSAVADRRTLHALVATPAGRTCAVVGIVLELAGALWMRRILAGVEQ